MTLKTSEQYLAALAVANETRIKRGRVKARLANGDQGAFKSTMYADPMPNWMRGEKIVTLFASLPRIGKQRAYKIIEEFGLPADARIGEVGLQVRLALFDRVTSDYKYAFRKQKDNEKSHD